MDRRVYVHYAPSEHEVEMVGNADDVRLAGKLLLDERGEAAVRDVWTLNERIFRFAQEDRYAFLPLDRGIEIFDAVLDDERLRTERPNYSVSALLI